MGGAAAKELSDALAKKGIAYIDSPVVGGAIAAEAGNLGSLNSGPKAAFDTVKPMIDVFCPRGTSYVGEGELSRICKIAHNVMLGVVIQNLIEITLLVNKMGVPRQVLPLPAASLIYNW